MGKQRSRRGGGDSIPVDQLSVPDIPDDIRAEFDRIDEECGKTGLHDLRGAIAIARRGLRLALRSGVPDAQVRFLLHIAYFSIIISDNTAGSRALNRIERIIAGEIVRDIRIIDATHFRGYFYQRKREYEKATACFCQALHLAEQAGNVFRIMAAHSSLGDIMTLVGDYAGALKAYLNALNVPGGDMWPQEVAVIHHNIATIYIKMEDWGDAQTGLSRVIPVFEELGNRGMQATACYNMGIVLARGGELAKGGEYLERSLAIHRDLGIAVGIGSCLTGLGEVCFYRGEYDTALRYFTEASEASILIGSKRQSIYITIRVGEVHIALERFPEAARILESGLEEAVGLGYRDYECEMLQRLADVYERTGRPLDSLQAVGRHIAVRHGLAVEERRDAFRRAQVRHALWEIEDERNRLLQEKERMKQEMERKERALASMTLRLTQTSAHLNRIREQIRSLKQGIAGTTARELLRSIDSTERQEKEWEGVERRLIELDRDLLRTLVDRYPMLTRTEAMICCLLRNNLSSKEISLLLGTSIRTVESHRRFIRKKLSIPGGVDLAVFLATL